MNKKTRYVVRRVIFILLIGLVGFTVYQAVASEDRDKPKQGEAAPNFTLTTLDGQTVQLSDLKGKAVMLNFWGTWCKPCRTEMPAMQAAYQKYKAQGFTIAAINIAETDIAASNFAKQVGISFPIWMDRNREVVKLYDIGPLPSSIFIDPDGTIVDRIEGPLQLSQLEYYIMRTLGG